jgi:hypothetical protein
MVCVPTALNVTRYVDGTKVPVSPQLPVTVALPAIVSVAPEPIFTLPNEMAAVGVQVPVPVNVSVLPVKKVRGVVTAVNPFLKLMVLPLDAVKTGATVPPKLSEGAVVPLKFIMPEPVTCMVPLLVPIVTLLPKVAVPVLTVITFTAVLVLPPQVTVPARLK